MEHDIGKCGAARARFVLPLVLRVVSLLLMGCLAACETMAPRNDTLRGLQEWAMLDPPSRLLADGELPREKAEMARGLERYLRGTYRVIDQRFVLTEPDFTEWALLESKAGQFMEQERGATYERQEWKRTGIDLVSVWKLGGDPSRYFALVMTDQALAGTDGRSLVGYFELTAHAE